MKTSIHAILMLLMGAISLLIGFMPDNQIKIVFGFVSGVAFGLGLCMTVVDNFLNV